MDGAVFRSAPEGDWPDAELEFLNRCPVCGSEDRTVAYDGLRDKVFFCAPGVWTSWRCAGCNVVYIDPRPTLGSIGRAYDSYYTHDETSQGVVRNGGLMSQFRRIVAHSYLNKNFGYKLRPSLPLAWLPLVMKPGRALSTAHYYRHLPAPRTRDDYLLDVGCGNGIFLQTARDDLGYEVEGLEIDPRARSVARRRGLKVHAELMPGSGLTLARYYQITLNHVLEHMHDPVAALQEVFDLLKPGGRVWIAVPNIAAASLSRFGSNSRLLEPPRHLVMFDQTSLRALLERVGFLEVGLLPNVGGDDFIFCQSWKIENGLDPNATPDSVAPLEERRNAMSSAIGGSVDASSAPIIIMTGSKAG